MVSTPSLSLRADIATLLSHTGSLRDSFFCGTSHHGALRARSLATWKPLLSLPDAHALVGVGLVNAVINDLLEAGTLPVAAHLRLRLASADDAAMEEILAGITRAAAATGLAIAGFDVDEGGDDSDFDVTITAVGVTPDGQPAFGSSNVGDRIYGLATPGLHTPCLGALERVLQGADLEAELPGGGSVTRRLTAPCKAFHGVMRAPLRAGWLSGIVHVAEGGPSGSLRRALPRHLRAVIDPGTWPLPPLFSWLLEESGLDTGAALDCWSCGLGLLVLVPAHAEARLLAELAAWNEPTWLVGRIEPAELGEDSGALRV